MIRKLILLLLSLGFIAGGIAFALTEMNLASSTADHNHIYAALFGGGLLGLRAWFCSYSPSGNPSRPSRRGPPPGYLRWE